MQGTEAIQIDLIQTALDKQDVASFQTEIENAQRTLGSPLLNGLSALSKLRVKNTKGNDVSLIDYVLEWNTPLNTNQKQICSILFDALGSHIIDGSEKNDPLMRACKNNNKDMVELLIPTYRKHQEVIIDNNNNNNNQKSNAKEEAVAKRILTAIQNTNSFEILDIIESGRNPHQAAMTPTLQKKTDTKSNETYKTKFEQAISEQRIHLQRINAMKNDNEDNHEAYAAVALRYGLAGGTTLMGAFVLTTYLVTTLNTFSRGEETMSGTDVIQQIGNWFWENICKQNGKPDTGELIGMIGLSTAFASAVIGTLAVARTAYKDGTNRNTSKPQG